jgi:hypothetical protein
MFTHEGSELAWSISCIIRSTALETLPSHRLGIIWSELDYGVAHSAHLLSPHSTIALNDMTSEWAHFRSPRKELRNFSSTLHWYQACIGTCVYSSGSGGTEYVSHVKS